MLSRVSTAIRSGGRVHLAPRCALMPSASVGPAQTPFPSTTAAWSLGHVRCATSKAGGSTKNGRDSQPKYLGVKRYGGHYVFPGDIILRQRGSKYGLVDSTATVARGKDWTVYAVQPGYVKFWFHAMKKKYFVEVVKSPPEETTVVEKYPIVRVKSWELPELLKLDASTPISDTVRSQLINYLGGIHPAHLRGVLPPGVPRIGRVDAVFWNESGGRQADAPNTISGSSRMVPPAMLAAAAAGTPASASV